MKLLILATLIVFLLPVQALALTIQKGSVSDIGEKEILTEFGMVIGKIEFKLGNLSWQPKEIWLLPSELDPEEFSKGLKQIEILEIPENVYWSKCRTAVYFNETFGYGFKIYNTQSSIQILKNGTFCGLAYEGTYFIFARY